LSNKDDNKNNNGDADEPMNEPLLALPCTRGVFRTKFYSYYTAVDPVHSIEILPCLNKSKP